MGAEALWLRGECAERSGAEGSVFPGQLQQVESLLKKPCIHLYTMTLILLSPLLSEYHWVRRENGQMTGLSKVTPCDNSIGIWGFVSQSPEKTHTI